MIPSLISVTQVYAQHERDLVTRLTQSHQSYLQADNQADKIAVMKQTSQAIDQFQVYLVSNPKLQSDQVFTNLQYELTGTENWIAVKRMRYDQAVQNYNQKLRLFPNSLSTEVFGLTPKPFFAAKRTNELER